MISAVFLDRDGVLNRSFIRNRKPFGPTSIAEFEIMPDARESLERLRTLGFLLIVVTNQPGARRGTTPAPVIEEMNSILRAAMPIDDIFQCFHDEDDGCDCRKPLPGLFHQAAERHKISLGDSFMIGDRWRDIEAGNAAGCKTIWIDYDYDERGPETPPSMRVSSLAEAVDYVQRCVQPGAK